MNKKKNVFEGHLRYTVRVEHTNEGSGETEMFNGISRTSLSKLLKKLAWVKQIVLTPEPKKLSESVIDDLLEKGL